MSSLKIGIDSSSAKKSLLDLANFAKRNMSKTGISLLDKNTSKILSGEANAMIDRLSRQTDRLRDRAKGYARELKDAAGNAERELRARQKLFTVTQRLSRVEQERQKLSAFKGSGGFGRGLSQSLGSLPGVGSLLRGPLGMGLMAGGAAIGAGAYGVSRLSTGFNRYSDGLDSRIKLMGRGVRDTDMNRGMRGAFSQVGMDEESVRQSRLQSMDTFGRGGSTQGQVLRRAQFSRNFGMDLSTLQGMGGGMRSQVGTRGANRDMMKLQAALMASEIKDAVGPFLETAANALVDIREGGLVNSGEVLGLLSSVARMTGNAPERVAGQLSGFQKAVQGSSGENNAFFQTAFARGGIGGGSVGGTQAAIRSGGIFGVNADDYGGLGAGSKKALSQLGLTGPGTGMEARIGSILDLADQTFGGSSPESQLAKARFMMPKLGAKNEIESMEMMDQFRAAQGDSSKMAAFEKKLTDKTSSPEERMLKNLEDINKSQEGSVQALQVIRRVQEEAMGKQVAPAAMVMSKALLHIDELITGIYQGLSSVVPGLRTETQRLSSATGGDSILSASQISEIRDRGKGEVSRVGGGMVNRMDEITGEISSIRKRRDFESSVGNSGMVASYDRMIVSMEKQLSNLNQSFNQLIGVQKEHVEVSRDHAAATKKVSKVPGKMIPAGSGKTR